MTNYQFEPHYDEENGVWVCQKLVNMDLPVMLGKFETEDDCQWACDNLNDLFETLLVLNNNYNIKLEVRELK